MQQWRHLSIALFYHVPSTKAFHPKSPVRCARLPGHRVELAWSPLNSGATKREKGTEAGRTERPDDSRLRVTAYSHRIFRLFVSGRPAVHPSAALRHGVLAAPASGSGHSASSTQRPARLSPSSCVAAVLESSAWARRRDPDSRRLPAAAASSRPAPRTWERSTLPFAGLLQVSLIPNFFLSLILTS